MIPCYVVCFMYESTQLNGTSIVPKPPYPPPLVVGAQQLKRTVTSLSSTNLRTQQLKGLALVYFEKKYQSLLNRKHKNRHRVNSHYQHKNNANKLAHQIYNILMTNHQDIMILSVKQRIVHLEKKYRSMTSLIF